MYDPFVLDGSERFRKAKRAQEAMLAKEAEAKGAPVVAPLPGLLARIRRALKEGAEDGRKLWLARPTPRD